MKKIMMIAAMKYSRSDGISKKICMQAVGLSSAGNKCKLFCLGENSVFSITYENGNMIGENEERKYSSDDEGLGGINQERDLLNTCVEFLNANDIDYVYIRHMLPCRTLIQLLTIAKKKKIKIGYEIPTYPYYREQLNVSNDKIKTLAKLGIESAYWPLIYHKIDILTVVQCNSKAHSYKKMFDITNGFAGEFEKHQSPNLDDINMIGVGTIYSYHGYEKIIRDMKGCNCKTEDGHSIYFHIVGKSEEIDRLKIIVSELNLSENVLFYGAQYGDSLMKLYDKCNLGVGTMALSLRNADIDTAIKNIEYLSFDLPVITSGYIFNIDENIGLYYRQDEKSIIDFERIKVFIKQFYLGEDKKVPNLLHSFEWNTIMNQIIVCLSKT